MLLNSVTYKVNLKIFVLYRTKIAGEQSKPKAKMFFSLLKKKNLLSGCIGQRPRHLASLAFAYLLRKTKVISHIYKNLLLIVVEL